MPDDNFIFLSHSSSDVAELRPVVEMLRGRGVEIWWSQDIAEGRWDRLVSEKLGTAQRVLGVITEKAETSSRDYILEELSLARDQDKLIPMVIGNRPSSFAFRGVINLIQTYTFDSIPSIPHHSDTDKLIATCLRALGKDDVSGESAGNQALDSAASRVEEWFDKMETELSPSGEIQAFSHALSVAIFEGGNSAEVESISSELTLMLVGLELGEESTADRSYPRRMRKKLELLECELHEVFHGFVGVSEPGIRFIDAERSAELLQFIWFEYGSRRSTIVEWLRLSAERLPAEQQMKLGFALGMLAQKRFLDTFESVLGKWLLSESTHCSSVADIALSVAAFEPSSANAMTQIVKNWASSGNERQIGAAVFLACGFAGSRLPGLTIEILQTVVERRSGVMSEDLFNSMQGSLGRSMRVHAENADNSLFDLSGLIESLANWILDAIAERDQGLSIRENPFPLVLFLYALEGLPLRGKRLGRLSLEALLAEDKIAFLTARVINLALERHRIGLAECRAIAQTVLKKWISQAQKLHQKDPEQQSDTLLRLARFMASTAPDQDDVDRIIFIFDPIFSEKQISATMEPSIAMMLEK